MFARTSRSARRTAALLASAALAASLGSAAVPAGATPAEPQGAPGPIHAGNTFGWYGRSGLVYDEDFVGPLEKRWQKEGHGQVRTQHGMLTLNTTHAGSVSAQLMRPGRAYGRWETRMRQREYGGGKGHYRVMAELVPVTKAGEGCGEQNIGFTKFTMGGDKVNFYVRSRPENLYQASLKRGLGQDQWHTYAVEVTPKHISWIVDSHVIRTERRHDALTGRKFQVRFTMEATKGTRMNKARMQMDWLRYWNLHSKDKKSIKAPEAKQATYTQSCAGKGSKGTSKGQ
jgi:beta-glucanase (GH16 family)